MDETQAAVIDWLATGELGQSSKCMAMYLAFGRLVRDAEYGAYPLDPDDMNRCLKLLLAAPGLRCLLPKMANVGKEWAALVARWEEIESMQLDEIGIDWKKSKRAPKTYKLMKEIIGLVNSEYA